MITNMKQFNSIEKMMKSVILRDMIGQEIMIDSIRCYIDDAGIWMYPENEYTEHIAENIENSMWGRILDMKIDSKPIWQRKIEPDGVDYETPFNPFEE